MKPVTYTIPVDFTMPKTFPHRYVLTGPDGFRMEISRKSNRKLLVKRWHDIKYFGAESLAVMNWIEDTIDTARIASGIEKIYPKMDWPWKYHDHGFISPNSPEGFGYWT
jgi:hypothetical protein